MTRATSKSCIRPGCTYARAGGKQRCIWHIMAENWPMDAQIEAARKRHERNMDLHDDIIARVPKSEWPPGERWCSGCQGFVPLFYCTGSKCRAHASESAHGARVEKVYGISRADYEALLELQGGVCFICGRAPRQKRLAVDHDHATGEVRGLLCANNEYGCNLAVIGNLENSPRGGLEAAKRVVEYLDNPPMRRLRSKQRESSRSLPEEAHHEELTPRRKVGAYSIESAPRVPAEPESRQPGAGRPDWLPPDF